jgi:hypothetical protein
LEMIMRFICVFLDGWPVTARIHTMIEPNMVLPVMQQATNVDLLADINRPG